MPHSVKRRPLPAITLGAAALGLLSGARAAPPAGGLQEIVVTAQRQSDALLTGRVETALRQNPYIYAEHITVTTENGVVRVGGLVRDMPELFAILKTARRIAGKGRVVNEIQFLQLDQDGN